MIKICNIVIMTKAFNCSKWKKQRVKGIYFLNLQDINLSNKRKKKQILYFKKIKTKKFYKK